MWPYWLLLLGPAYLALASKTSTQKISSQQDKHLPVIWQFVFLFLTLMVGFRYQVGGDWPNYLQQVDDMRGTLFTEAIASKDPAYKLLSWLGSQTGAGVYLGNMVCAIFFASGLIGFCRSQPQPWLALAVAVPYLVTVVAMGYTRQGVAIGISMLGLVALSQGLALRFVLWIFLAATFHASAIVLIPLAALISTRKRLLTIVWVCVVGLALFVLLLQEYVDNLLTGYLEAGYQSSGAAIRIAMNTVPAVLFLTFRNRFKLDLREQIFWTAMSWTALLFVVLLMVSPSSTAVDRVALYWIPLQLFVLSRLPQALGQRIDSQRQWLLVVLAYTFVVHFIWLFYADSRLAWLPYRFYPWEWLWT
jgi:hypothetical protein